MRTIVLVISLIALAAPAHAAQKTRTGVDDAVPMEKRCRDLVGKDGGKCCNGLGCLRLGVGSRPTTTLPQSLSLRV